MSNEIESIPLKLKNYLQSDSPTSPDLITVGVKEDLKEPIEKLEKKLEDL